MDNSSKDNEDNGESTHKQILEYYRKYSQSRDLPKYFSGTSISYLPKIVDDEGVLPQIVIEKASTVNVTEDQKIFPDNSDPHQDLPHTIGNIELDPELSPTASVTSNRKLEWDNLGDIGYSNVKRVYKSASLPILRQIEHSGSDKQSKTTSDTGSNVKIVIYPYTSSSEERSNGKITINSSISSYSYGIEKVNQMCSSSPTASNDGKQLTGSDSDSSVNHKNIVDFKYSLDDLKKKVGLPGAHSTPNDPKNTKDTFDKLSVTPFVKKNGNSNKPQELEQKSEEIVTDLGIELTSKKKVVRLCLTKPLLLDCFSKSNGKRLTVGIQTDDAQSKTPAKQQELNLNKHPDDNVPDNSSKTSSSNAGASNCDSFEFIKSVTKYNTPLCMKREHSENLVVFDQNEKSEGATKFEENEIKSDKIETSTNIPASRFDHKTIDNDIEKNIYVLQRLIRTKKYDCSTKKRYIRKILQKITESKYLEDSSTSSDLFYPKTDPSKILLDQRKYSCLKNELSSSSYQSHEEKKSSFKKKVSECSESDISSIKDRKATTVKLETVGSNLHKKELKSIQKKKAENLQPKESKVDVRIPEYKEPKKTPFTVSKPYEPSASDKPFPQSYQNWKELLTTSEKKFEHKDKAVAGGDQLTQFSDNEREYQLNWIDRKIDHLGKLKCLLEKTDKLHPTPESVKTTSVYMVGTNNALKRNYVIETKLGAGISQERKFRLNGESYIIQDSNHKSNNELQPPVVADIKVLSDDNTTNIRVTTFCALCKRAPCVCVTGLTNLFKSSDDARKQSLNKKENQCSCNCSCNSESTSGSSGSRDSLRTVCIVCHRSPCTCCSCKVTHDVKTCSVCKLYSCMCYISPKSSEVQVDTYARTFELAEKYVPAFEKNEEKMCCKCGVWPCLCKAYLQHKPEKEVCQVSPNVTDSDVKLSRITTRTNSLAKVFIDCKCATSEVCSCGFVESLLKHFNIEEPRQAIKEGQIDNKIIDAQEYITNSTVGSQTPTFAHSSKATETDKLTNSNKLVQAGIQDESTTSVVKSAIVTENMEPIKSDEIVETDKCVAKSVNEKKIQSSLQNLEYKKESVDVGTSPRITQCYDAERELIDAATSPRTARVDRGTTVVSSKEVISVGTHPKVIEIERGTDTGITRKVSVDMATSPIITGIAKETCTVDSRKDLVDKSTSLRVNKAERGTETVITTRDSNDNTTTSRIVELDRGTDTIRKDSFNVATSSGAFIINKDMASNTSEEECPAIITKKNSVDKSTSPVIYTIDKETELSSRLSVNKSTSPIVSEAEKILYTTFGNIGNNENTVFPTSTGKLLSSSPLKEPRNDLYQIPEKPSSYHNVSSFTSSRDEATNLPVYYKTVCEADKDNQRTAESMLTNPETTIDRAIQPPVEYKEVKAVDTKMKSKGISNTPHAFNVPSVDKHAGDLVQSHQVDQKSIDILTKRSSKDVQPICLYSMESSKTKCICCDGDKHKKLNTITCCCGKLDHSQNKRNVKIICLNEICEIRSRRISHKHKSSYCSECGRCKINKRCKSSSHSDSRKKDKCHCSCICDSKKIYKCYCPETSDSTIPNTKTPSTEEPSRYSRMYQTMSTNKPLLRYPNTQVAQYHQPILCQQPQLQTASAVVAGTGCHWRRCHCYGAMTRNSPYAGHASRNGLF